MSERSCPLGHTCSQCHWEVEMHREDKRTGELAVDRVCAIPEMVRAQVATFQMTHSLGAVMEDARNHTIERQDKLLTLVGGGK